MAKGLLQINCQNGMRRNLLRISLLTFPAWGVISLMVIAYSCMVCALNGQPGAFWYPISDMAILIAYLVLLVGTCVTYSLCRSKLSISEDAETISFPGFLTCNLSLKRLKKLKLQDGYLDFFFRDVEDVAASAPDETIGVAVDRISRADRLQLLRVIDEHAKNCTVSKEVRRLFEFGEAQLALEASQSVLLPYENQSKLKDFYELLLNYEPTFWKVWFGTFLPPVFFATPFVILAPVILWMHWLNMDKIMNWTPLQDLVTWGTAWRPFAETTANSLGVTLNTSYYFLNGSFEISMILAAIAACYSIRILNICSKPNAVLLSNWGIQFDPGHFGFHFDPLKFQWQYCRKVQFIDNDSRSSTTDETVTFLDEFDKPLAELNLQGLSRVGDKQILKDAIETWAPKAELDVRFVETINAPRSYTELWLRSLNTPPKRDRLAPLQQGDFLLEGGLRILDTLGAGGQGVAYLAEYANQAKGQKELVVVKEFILPVYVDRRVRVQALERFERESSVLRSLSHEKIVQLKDHFIEDHRAYLVLEHISGKSLRKLVTESGGIQNEQTLCNIVRQMCEVLEYLHSQSPPVVHRDFAPDNLILREDGTLKLIDFNVAHQQAKQDNKVTVVGKRSYMPPEQFAGRPTTQSDIYALGATLYFLITGDEPQPFSELQLPEEITSLNSDWQELLAGCTKLETSQRFSSCQEILLLLEKLEGTKVALTESVISR